MLLIRRVDEVNQLIHLGTGDLRLNLDRGLGLDPLSLTRGPLTTI